MDTESAQYGYIKCFSCKDERPLRNWLYNFQGWNKFKCPVCGVPMEVPWVFVVNTKRVKTYQMYQLENLFNEVFKEAQANQKELIEAQAEKLKTVESEMDMRLGINKALKFQVDSLQQSVMDLSYELVQERQACKTFRDEVAYFGEKCEEAGLEPGDIDLFVKKITDAKKYEKSLSKLSGLEQRAKKLEYE